MPKQEETPKLKKIHSERKSETGTVIYLGTISSDEYVNELIGPQKIETYDKMMRSSATVSEVVDLVTLPIRSATWDIEPISSQKQDVEVADYVKYSLFEGMNMTWDALLEAVLKMMPFGFSLFEKVWKEVEWNGETKIGLDLYVIGQKTVHKWVIFDEDGNEIPGIHQMTEQGHEAFLSEEDIVRFTYRQTGDDYEGLSILRAAYPHWYSVLGFYRVSSAAYERTAMGIPKGTVPSNATPDQKRKFENILKNVRANENAFLSMPNGFDIEMLDPKANSQMDPMPLISHHDIQIARSALVSFMHLGQTQNGSRAASYDQSTMFEQASEAVGRQIIDVIQKAIIRQLVDYNFDVKEYPKLTVSGIKRDDIDKLSTSLERFGRGGFITPDPTTEQSLRRRVGLPEKEEAEEVEEESDPMRPAELQTEEDEEHKEDVATASVKKKASSKVIAGKWNRVLTAAEKKVPFDNIQKRIERGEDIIKNKLGDLSEKQIQGLLEQVRAAINSEDTLSALRILTTGLKDQYEEVTLSELRGLFEYAKVSTADEMEAVLGEGMVNAPGTSEEEIAKLQYKAATIANDNDMKMAAQASIIASELYIAGRTAEEVTDLVSQQLREAAEKRIELAAASAVVGVINQGRTFTQERNSDKIYSYQYSAILDQKTCNTCLALDGKTIDKDDKAFKQLQPPQHFRCRCIWVEILEDETDKPPITGIPDFIDQDLGLSNFKQVDKKKTE